jgi:uncharacterized membrane protein (DUF106 family)
MQAVGKIITWVFELILTPFSDLSPIWGLLAVSVLTGIVMVLIFKYTSNQPAIRSTKDKISAYFMEIRLFKDDLGLMLDAQKRILRTNLTYMKYSVIPMLVMIVPVILILVQLGIRYAARPLEPGENAIVELKLAENPSTADIPISVEPGNGIRLETPLLRMPGKVSFRIGAVTEGEHELSILVGDERVSKTIVVSGQVRPVYAVKAKPSFMGALLYPGQAPLPEGSQVEEIYVKFPPQEVKVFGWNINWLVFFFIISIIAGYSLKGVFRVEV